MRVFWNPSTSHPRSTTERELLRARLGLHALTISLSLKIFFTSLHTSSYNAAAPTCIIYESLLLYFLTAVSHHNNTALISLAFPITTAIDSQIGKLCPTFQSHPVIKSYIPLSYGPPQRNAKKVGEILILC